MLDVVHRRLAAQRLIEARRQPPRRVLAARPQQMVAHRDLDQDGQVAARRDRHAHRRDRHAEDRPRTSRRGRAARTRAAGSQRSSLTTSSTRFDVRVAVTPNRSRTLIRPMPRSSMWWRVSGGQVPMTMMPPAAARRRRRRRPGGGRGRSSSSAHSLLPMPLSPTISTPRPRTSTSTPCRCARGASRSSSSAPSLASARGVESDVRSSGTPRRSAGATRSGGRLEALGEDDAGAAAAKTRAIRAARRRSRRVRGSAPRSGRRPARGPPAATRRSRPAPARPSADRGCRSDARARPGRRGPRDRSRRGRPTARRRRPSRFALQRSWPLRCGDRARGHGSDVLGRDRGFRVDETEPSVRPLEQNGQALGLGVPEDDEGLAHLLGCAGPHPRRASASPHSASCARARHDGRGARGEPPAPADGRGPADHRVARGRRGHAASATRLVPVARRLRVRHLSLTLWACCRILSMASPIDCGQSAALPAGA